MKINAKKIGFAKPFEVKPSVKNQLRSLELSTKILKLNAMEARNSELDPTDPNYADETIKVIEGEQNIAKEALNFLKDVFKLTDKQLDKVEETVPSVGDLSSYISYVVQRIQGMSDKQIELANQEQSEKTANEDPKN